jgi:hypothetical protein
MFCPFTIKTSVISQLQRETSSILVVKNGARNKEYRKAILRSYLNSASGIIDGKTLKELWFPKGRYQVFLSHSHGDIAFARYFKAWLSYNCGLRCFIDTDVWENAYDLLYELDVAYSKKNDSPYFSYNRRNHTTAHVYSMLTMALFEAIDEIECPVLIESSNSVTLKEGIEKGTLSPWIYEEVGYMGKLPHNVPDRIKTQCFSVGRESVILEKSIRDSLQMTHPLDVSGFKSIDKEDLDIMKSYKSVDALDKLYKRKGLICPQL